MINNTTVDNKHTTKADIKAVYPITFSGATDSGGLPMFKVTLTYADGSSKELKYNIDYALVYDDIQENNNESFNEPHLNGIKFLLPQYAVAGNTLYILRTTPFVQPVDFQIGRIDPEQIEKIADLSVLRDQEIRNQADKDRDNISDLYDITAGFRVDVDTAQKTADDAMAHTVTVEKRVTQAEKNIANNDVDIANIFDHQEEQDGRLTNLENSKIDKNQGEINIGKVLTVGGDGMVVPKVPQGGGSGIGAVAHDSTLIGAGTDEYPLGVKNKVTITIVEH